MDANAHERLTGAEIIVEYLCREDITHLFGVCGHGNVGFLDAAYQASNRIKTVSLHHEQSAGYMADAYFKVKHAPAATFTSCGPGSANLVISLAAAMMDSSAFLAITANVPTSQFNRGPFQETGILHQGDFPSVIRPYVKRSFQPTRVDMVPLAMRQACQFMRDGRPGPVNVDVPLNLFVESEDVTLAPLQHRLRPCAPGSPQEVQAAVDMLLSAERPVIVAGQGAILSEASAALAAFAEKAGIPVVTSPNGKGSINERHPLAYGVIGRNGTYAANDASCHADVILALGFSFDDRATSGWLQGYTFSIPPSKLIHVDIDIREIGRNYPSDLGIVADARAFLEAACERVGQVGGRDPARIAGWIDRLNHGRTTWKSFQERFVNSDQVPLRPERLMHALSRALPEDAIIASDVGVHHNWVIQLWETLRPRQLLQSWGFAAMGYATSGILGAKLAAPDRPCVAVAGDGSFLMTPHILATAKEYEIPAVWVVWNNFGYGSIRDLQHGLFGGRELATSFMNDRTGELYSPDFCTIAKAFGVDSIKITAADQVEDALKEAVDANRPYLIEVPVDRDIRPVGTGSWELPPIPHSEPDYLEALAAEGFKL